MGGVTRRDVLAAGGLAVAGSAISLQATGVDSPAPAGLQVKLVGDGLSLAPEELAAVLQQVVAGGAVQPDDYSNGGVVAAMEAAFAAELGKERAVFFPTGTLANHVAIRVLAGSASRVLLQERSHVYNDSGDCAQVLSHLNLVPLGKGAATFTAGEVETELARAATGRVRTEVGVISIESPVRRKLGETFDLEEMKRIATLARERGIRLHLDGARLYLAAAYTGVAVRDVAALFDTVYVSLWKYFNAPFGAVLAGPARLLEDIYHLRRMFGGSLPYAWPAAAVALHFQPGFLARFALAKEQFEKFLTALERAGRFRVERIPRGTNHTMIKWDGEPAPETLRERLAALHVSLAPPSTFFRGLVVTCNETLARVDGEHLAALFLRAS